jgi:hypothetical protein
MVNSRHPAVTALAAALVKGREPAIA